MTTLQCPACGLRFDPEAEPFCPGEGCGFPAEFAADLAVEREAPEEILRRPDEPGEGSAGSVSSEDWPGGGPSAGEPQPPAGEPAAEPSVQEPPRSAPPPASTGPAVEPRPEPPPQQPRAEGTRSRGPVPWGAVAAGLAALVVVGLGIVMATRLTAPEEAVTAEPADAAGETEQPSPPEQGQAPDPDDGDPPPPDDGEEPPPDDGGQLAQVQVVFVEEGDPPGLVAVERTVEGPQVAAGALAELFAGPAAAEQEAGLTLRTSGVSGVEDLAIGDGVASLTLLGGCEPEADGVTIADHLVPTLRQFGSVDRVELVHAQDDGSVETVEGDVLPSCLVN